MAELFLKAGFEVVEARSDLGNLEFKRVAREFTAVARDADIAVMYFAGHGIEVNGVNYLLPVDAKLEARRGDVEAAVTTATEAARLAEATDGLNRRAQVQLDLREVLLAAGRRREAAAALELAAELFEAKGNVVGGARARSLRDDPALV